MVAGSPDEVSRWPAASRGDTPSPMRVGILITFLGVVLINLAMWTTKPDLDAGFFPDRAKAEAMTTGLENWWCRRPLGAQVYALSWRKWYGEAYEGQKPDLGGGTSSSELVHLMGIGCQDIQHRMVAITVATFGGALVSWGVVVFFAWLNKKKVTGRGTTWLVGRLMLLLSALFLASIAAPIVITQDGPGLVFSAPLVIGLVAALVFRKKGEAPRTPVGAG